MSFTYFTNNGEQFRQCGYGMVLISWQSRQILRLQNKWQSTQWARFKVRNCVRTCLLLTGPFISSGIDNLLLHKSRYVHVNCMTRLVNSLIELVRLTSLLIWLWIGRFPFYPNLSRPTFRFRRLFKMILIGLNAHRPLPLDNKIQ